MNIESLTEKHKHLFKHCFDFSVDDGWLPLINDMFNMLTSKHYHYPIDILQIKQKFGRLTVYFAPFDQEIYNDIEVYCNKSMEICEICGDIGELCRSESGWIRTLCSKHLICNNETYKYFLKT